jgi:hypothetical protein
MVRKINYGKILLVVFLTVLIWVWADLALDEGLPVSGATISVAKSTNPNLWASFNDDESFVSIADIVLKGPASRIGNARRKLNDGSLVLEFFLDVEREGLTEAGQYSLDMLAFLKKSAQIKELGLTVESCEPDKLSVKVVKLVELSVKVVKLVEKQLTVKCFDEDGTILKAESKPSKVDMFVPEDWEGEQLIAEVRLMRGEVKQARLEAVAKKPYIELAPDQIREAAGTVEIKMPPQEDRLIDYTITGATPGITLSPTLLGKYDVNDVEIENLPEVIGGITIRATPEAKRAYEKMRYQVILEIDDEDAESIEPLKKELIYNFPADYVRKDEIMLNQQPVIARFKLKLLSPAKVP